MRRGTERLVHELAAGLLRRGHRPELITSHPGWPRRTVEDGLPVLRLPRPPERPLERAGVESHLTHVPLSYLALRAGRYDLAHAVHPSDGLAAARWRRVTGRPAVLSYMGIPDRRWLASARGRREVLRRACAGCDAVVVLSRHAAAALADSLAVRARVIAPGVDLGAFAPAPARFEQPTLLCSADPEVPRKNVGLLVRAFALVRREIPEARLILSRPRSGRPVAGLQAAGVVWLDLDDRAELARACGRAWVSVLPAGGEAFGLVLAEALACGTPVVGYADGGIPEIIDRPEVGRLFDALEPAPLARALLEAIELAREDATVGRCRARAERFSIDRCVESYLSLYRELLRGPTHPRRRRRNGASISR